MAETDTALYAKTLIVGDVVFVLGAKRVPVTRDQAQFLHDWSQEANLAMVALRSKITAAIRMATPTDDGEQVDGEVVLTALDEAQREQLFLELHAMEEDRPLEEGLRLLKNAASEPISLM